MGLFDFFGDIIETVSNAVADIVPFGHAVQDFIGGGLNLITGGGAGTPSGTQGGTTLFTFPDEYYNMGYMEKVNWCTTNYHRLGNNLKYACDNLKPPETVQCPEGFEYREGKGCIWVGLPEDPLNIQSPLENAASGFTISPLLVIGAVAVLFFLLGGTKILKK